MPAPDLRTVTYRDHNYSFPASALGGTADAPRLRAVEELLLDWWHAQRVDAPEAGGLLLHDRYGVLGTCLRAENVSACSDVRVHFDRLAENFRANAFPDDALPPPLSPLAARPAGRGRGLLCVPKSLELFERYLYVFAEGAVPGARLAAGFLTRHFSPRLLRIAERYAGTVTQSRAARKARLLLLADFRKPAAAPEAHRLQYGGTEYFQYGGVFSAGHVDYASRFLLEQWPHRPALRDLPAPTHLLDIGCGNGVIGDQLRRHHYPEAALAGTDVSALAVASARRNLGPAADLHWRADLAPWPDATFDLIVTNPPFHEGHHNTIAISLALFRQAAAKLAPAGHFVVVANRHLNYATHLRRHFGTVVTVAENRKFVIYRCAQVPG